MFKRVIIYHIIKLYQYRQINIDKQCFYKRSTKSKKVQVQVVHTLHSPLPNYILFFPVPTR